MARFINGVKTAVLKGMEAVGKGASNMATNAQQKLTEINLETRRREIISEFPMRAFDLWQKGEELPEPLITLLQEISDLDERLNVMRAQRYARVESHDKDKEAAEEVEGADVTCDDCDDACAETCAETTEAIEAIADETVEDAVETAADSVDKIIENASEFINDFIEDSPIEAILEGVQDAVAEYDATESTEQAPQDE